jgi:phosphoribosylglycinamide formyltransferase-1
VKRNNFEIVVCSSGGGGNLRAILLGASKGKYLVSKVIVDRECNATKVAQDYGIPAVSIPKPFDLGSGQFIQAIPGSCDLIVLAGFMPIVSSEVLARWQGRIINTHPSILPAHGGLGMYGVRVQESVIESEDKWAGCTVHFVDETIDGGKIIAQKKTRVRQGESPWELGGRIFDLEGPLLVKTISKFAKRRKGI